MNNIKLSLVAIAVSVLLVTGACTKQGSVSYKDQVKTALEQADLREVAVSEDVYKNTITLSGKLHSEDSKDKAAQVAKDSAGNRIIVNEISVEPVGMEAQAKSVSSNLDDGIENNYKAALVSKRLDKQSIRYDAKNGVLTLKGSVKTPGQKAEAERLASNIPNVQQVVNQLEVSR